MPDTVMSSDQETTDHDMLPYQSRERDTPGDCGKAEMMPAPSPVPVVYDLSRLITRVLNATPNGIDRIDFFLGRHFLGHDSYRTNALTFGLRGPRLLSSRVTLGATDKVAAAWKENDTAADYSAAYEKIVARLCNTPVPDAPARRIVQPRPKRSVHIARALLRYTPRRGAAPEKGAPDNAIYFNATHFPLDWDRHIAWLDKRLDIRPVFFIHDLLPVERPEWFWDKEPLRHRKRLDLLARRGAAAIVTSTAVEESLQRHMYSLGRKNLPVFRRPAPIGATFSALPVRDKRLETCRFFVTCGTIEPRKNHLLLASVWKKLLLHFGADAPKLIIIGKRGWKCESITSAIGDPALAGHILEVSGLASSSYKRLLDHCTALLAPSFAEGFGLPLAEALAAGAPAIVSDIAAFREQAGHNVTYLDPHDEDGWFRAIVQLSQNNTRICDRRRDIQAQTENTEQTYLAALHDFLSRL